ncbi:MAG: phage portal protein [Prevotellaceae bacterium]|nr:phage portal protein [Candidatus Faecinaster equi]
MAIFQRKKELAKKEKIEQGIREYFELLPAYSHAFTTFEGGMYEMELTRAAIHTFANHCCNLEAHVNGNKYGNKQIERALRYRPNELLDAKKYLYRIATITKCYNNAYIAPLYDEWHQRIIGFYPLHPKKCQIKEMEGEKWLIYNLVDNKQRVVRLRDIGIINQFQNFDELFGEDNHAINSTLQLMHTQDEAIVEAVKSSSNIRFFAKLGQNLRAEDIDKERDRFAKANLKNNKTSVMLVDAKYAEVKQLESNQFTIDDKQMQLIKENVFDYMGVSENIIQNKFTPDEWNAYYESQIEPFALEMGLVHTDMLFSDREIAAGNEVKFTANRMNYLGTSTKVNLIQTLFDRGLLTPNESREILDMNPIPNGDKFYIRKEYTEGYNEVETEEEGAETDDT